jgi:hypothetical protein
LALGVPPAAAAGAFAVVAEAGAVGAEFVAVSAELVVVPADLVPVAAELVAPLAVEAAPLGAWTACPSGWAVVRVAVVAGAVVVAGAWVLGCVAVLAGARVLAWVAVLAVGFTGAEVAGADGWVGSAGASPWVTAVTVEVTGLVTVPTTEPTVPLTEPPPVELAPAEPAGAVDDPGPVSAETADVTADEEGGGSSPVAACACLERSSNRKKIPAATIANCATRTAARCASSCDIDSSHPQETGPGAPDH